jgi:hypothetical protein
MLKDLLRLAEAECSLLTTAQRGEGLLLAADRRLRVHVAAAHHEAAMISIRD